MERSTNFLLACIKTLLFVAVVVSAVWSKTALYFLMNDFETLRTVLPMGFVALWILAFVLLSKTHYVIGAYFLSVLAIVIAFVSMQPSNNKEWLEEYARMPRAEYHGHELIIQDIRDFEYHGSHDNYTPRYKTITYDINDLQGVDFILSHWDDQIMIAHSMLVFRFKNTENLVVSVETRREEDEPWDIPRGFFQQYELIYVLGTEEDLIGRRINISNQDVFLYPTTLNKKQVREVLDNTMREINTLYEQPKFYNTLTKNCTSTLFDVSRRPELFDWFNPQILLNGASDRLLRKLGVLRGEGTYWEFKYNHYISQKGKEASSGNNFSELIRSNIRD